LDKFQWNYKDDYLSFFSTRLSKLNIMLLKQYFIDFVNLLFPKVCYCCNEQLLNNEELICTKCYIDLPRIIVNDNENPVEKVFWGRVKTEKVFSFVQYAKGGKFQDLIHQLKYKGKKEIGFGFGKRFAKEVKNELKDIDIIIPVPLHWRKFKKRGFNQAEEIAKGIAEVLNKPLNTKDLKRIIENPTQTRKSRYHRWENVEGIFAVKEGNSLSNKHVLLVDDVLTTGATLEACAMALQHEVNMRISIFTLGYA